MGDSYLESTKYFCGNVFMQQVMNAIKEFSLRVMIA